jgi:N12 class adenine-specific DNA methylase
VFDESNPTYAAQRQELRGLLSDPEWQAASRTTINAHYTDAAFVAAMWSGLGQLGFTGGDVLEPGCGSGTFIGLAPEGTRMTGVELDPITAAIAGHLYPRATVVAESFADTRTPAGTYDAVIGNVPFANVKLTDPVHNQAGHAMHNHFIIKSLALTKPGGTVAVLTSRYTMDAQNPAARRAIAADAVLLGAVRLPNGAHQRTAGTQVITDLLVLRKRDGTEAGPDPDWELAEPTDLGEGSVRINTYFRQHPAQVLGELSYEAGRYASGDLRVTATGDAAPALEQAVARIVTGAINAGLTHHPRPLTATERGAAALIGAPVDRFVGHLAERGGQFTRRTSTGVEEPLSIPRTQQAELARLLGLRDSVVAVLQAEAASSDDTPELTVLRTELSARYDAYAAAHGPLRRVQERRTGRVDADTGVERMAQIRPPVMRTFASDPFAPTVAALEIYDAETQTASKAAIQSQRVVAPRTPRLGADSPADALAICVDTHAEVRIDEVARLLGTSTEAARDGLRGLVYDDPETGRLLPAAEYLSGNVRTRLTAANAAALEDPRYAENVTALQAVIPEDLGPGDVDARLGAAWIGADDVQAFLWETLEDRSVRVVHTVGADWSVTGGRRGVLSTSEWGTERMPAPRLAQDLLKQATTRVSDEMEDGTRVVNPTETAAAQDKAAALNERFSEWVWEDPERAARLAGVYNERFNALVLRTYDTTNMELPGLARTFIPRPHQMAAVARMVAEPNAGLFHAVGAGKTAEMAMGVMEMRRLGLVRKPAIVVPNHMLDQFSSEFLQLYPQARVLAAGSDDLAGDKRRDFVARTTAGEWDAVIMTRTAFNRLPVSAATERDYQDSAVQPHREALARMVGDPGSAMTVKRLEKQLLAREERMKAKLERETDPGVLFEMTGIDYLVVDELHDYKNLSTPSNIRDAAIDGSVRAEDLHMKVEYLRAKHNGRALTGATATPIANSITEAYVMQRYLRPDLLSAAGVDDFDTWAATFASTVTEMEMSPDGGSWRMKTRFAKFRNIPEFLRMWHVAADVKTPEDLALPTPPLARRADGQRAPETIVIDPTPEVAAFVRALGERAEAVRNGAVDPRDDNMLKISSQGRAAALDLRLLPHVLAAAETPDGTLGEEGAPGKLAAAADRIAAVWRENTTRAYLGPDGAPHPRPGGLQLVFSDLGTPREAWNVYDELRDQLVARGLPAAQVAFIHSARNDREKAALFEACRSGQVQVLLGSTAKMGVGTNVQARAVALHHLDCPWRPADLAQREGRIERQGNQNPEITIYRYVTTGTFDTYSWLLNRTDRRGSRTLRNVMSGSV